ncbi:MAG: sigma-E factor negative regulatory protein RseB [Halioglobus sp.]|jgi:sigma-E factor negative regulatory protein RseB
MPVSRGSGSEVIKPLRYNITNRFLGLLLLSLLAMLPLSQAASASVQSCKGADPEALQWLDKMATSLKRVSYHGVVTLHREDEMQVIQVSHLVGPQSSSERLIQLTGQGAQVERGVHPLTCAHPGHQLLQIGNDLLKGGCSITQQYRLKIVDNERVAGRKAVRIQIAPRDMYRYGYVMSLDRETGLLLKTKVIGLDKKVLERFEFANLSYSQEMPTVAEVDIVHHAKHPHPGAPSDSSLQTEGWKVRWVPNGFVATDSSSENDVRRTYTDGLAVFSVFMEDLDREIRPGEGLVREGGTTSYTRGMRVAGRPILVTVIGEVPVNTARIVADSVSWAK